ncbi:MAG TPA: hypothetical protein VH599_03530 [Ktedonobacterales bacterium]
MAPRRYPWQSTLALKLICGSRWGWLKRSSLAGGFASFFFDLGHEIRTSLLPASLVGTLGVPFPGAATIQGGS